MTEPRSSSFSGLSGRPRGAAAAGLALVALGLCLLIWTLSGLPLWRLWPLVFLIPATLFLWPLLSGDPARRKAAAMEAIPGISLADLGFLFLYSSLSGDWSSWAFLWTLIPLGWGLGMVLAGRLRQNARLIHGGAVTCTTSLVGFTLFSAFLGYGLMRLLGPATLIIFGLLVLVGNVRQRPS